MPRRGITTKSPRLTYGQQRSYLDQDIDTEDRSSDSEGNQTPPPTSPAFTRSSNAPPGLKRSRSSRASSGLKNSLSSANNSPQDDNLPDTGGINNVQLQDQKIALASHELRESGQSHRFRDEIDYVLDGIRNKDKLKVRRSSCLELTKSMLNEDFVRQLRVYHYLPTIFNAIRKDKDPVVFSCLTLMIALILLDARDAYKEIVTVPDLVQFLCQSLDLDMDPMAIIPNGKQDALMHNEFKELARQSGIMYKGQKVLTYSVLLSTLTIIINEAAAKKDVQTMTTIDQDSDFLNTIIEILIEDLAWIKEPSSSPHASLPDVLDIARIESCLRILERLALVSKKPRKALAESTRLFTLLSQLIIFCRAHAFQYPQRKESMNLILHTLRLLINVTNGFEPCCERLAESEAIPTLIQNIIQFYGHSRNFNPELEMGQTILEQSNRAALPETRIHWSTQATGPSGSESTFSTLHTRTVLEDMQGNQDGQLEETGERSMSAEAIEIQNDTNGWYDILLLSIGLLINILETNPRHRETVATQEVALNCKALGDCFHTHCKCEKSTEALERLVGIYNIEVTISELTENQVLAAYLALMLGCIVDGSQEREARLHKAVERQTLVPMLELLSEFSDFNQTVHQTHQEQQQGDTDRIMVSQNQQLSQESTTSSLSRANSFMTLTLNENDNSTGALPSTDSSLRIGSLPRVPSGIFYSSPPVSPMTSLANQAFSLSFTTSTPPIPESSPSLVTPPTSSKSTAAETMKDEGISFKDFNATSSGDESNKSFHRIIEILRAVETRYAAQQ